MFFRSRLLFPAAFVKIASDCDWFLRLKQNTLLFGSPCRNSLWLRFANEKSPAIAIAWCTQLHTTTTTTTTTTKVTQNIASAIRHYAAQGVRQKGDWRQKTWSKSNTLVIQQWPETRQWLPKIDLEKKVRDLPPFAASNSAASRILGMVLRSLTLCTPLHSLIFCWHCYRQQNRYS